MSVNGDAPAGRILTLEPLLDAVRDGVEAAGWSLSGLQKTTSHQFEGRWEGEDARSAYVFYHRDDGPDWASVEAFLDETGRGLSGNLSLVADLKPLADVGPAGEVLTVLGAAARDALPKGYRTPLTLRFRLRDARDPPYAAETEIRFKIRIPPSAIQAGASAVSALATSAVSAFEQLLRDERLLARVPDPS